MQEFVISLLTCSATMSAVALFYMAAMPLLAKRYSERGRYYAWLIIILGLIIPFRPQWDNALIKINVTEGITAPIIQTNSITPVAPPNANSVATVLPGISWWQIAAAVWFAGMAIAIAYHGVRHYRFMKMAMRWSDNITDKQALTLLHSLKAELGISSQVGLYLCSSVGSPIMVGFVKPRILLPVKDFEPDELRFVIEHELVHHKRKDLYYKCTVLLATCIHWFNPFVYLVAKAIDAGCELSCDAEIVHSTSIDTRRHYSETIIGVVRYQSKQD